MLLIARLNVDISIPTKRISVMEIEKGGDMRTFEEEEVFTIAQVQKRLKIGKTKAHALIATRSIPSFRVGKLVRVKKADLERFIEDNRY